MWVFRAMASATLIAAMVSAGEEATVPAHASSDSVAINGTYRATSDGVWAKTNYSFHDEETVTSTWTIASTCSDYLDCTGRVTSDQGWSADLRMQSNMWFVARDLPNWERCEDGTTISGRQKFKFSVVDDNNLSGWDTTVGPSGACGVNKNLVVELPFKLVKIG